MFISSLITRLILNYEVNVNNKSDADRIKLLSYEKAYNSLATIANPNEQQQKLKENLGKIVSQLNS